MYPAMCSCVSFFLYVGRSFFLYVIHAFISYLFMSFCMYLFHVCFFRPVVRYLCMYFSTYVCSYVGIHVFVYAFRSFVMYSVRYLFS